MRTLVWGKTFIRALKRTLKKNLKLKLVIEDTLRLLQEVAFAPKLETHKLKGKISMIILIIILTMPVHAINGADNTLLNGEECPVSSNQVSQDLKINVYIDASGSMMGFATKQGDSSTIYAQTLIRIEGCKDSFPESAINFYKFACTKSKLTIAKLLNRSFHQAFEWEFYNGSTLINEVIKNINVENLSVIVTDLFQNNADIGTVVDIINKKCFSSKSKDKGTSIGLIRISSHFDGAIGQLGNKVSFRHEGTLSFYVMVIGSYPDVNKFSNILLNGLEGINAETNYIILSPYLVPPLYSFASVDLKAIKAQKNLKKPNLVTVGNQPGFQFRVKTKHPEASFSIDLTLKKDTHTILWDNQMEFSANYYIKDSDNWVKAYLNEDVMKVSLRDGSISEIDCNIGLNFSLIPRKLQRKKSYHFIINAIPKQNSCRVPDWVKAWDMGVSKSLEWSKEQSKYKGTTLNLRLFIERIWRLIETSYANSTDIFHLYFNTL